MLQLEQEKAYHLATWDLASLLKTLPWESKQQPTHKQSPMTINYKKDFQVSF